jgi:ferredoxin
MTGVELTVDPTSCAGSGICSHTFPEYFTLGADGIARATFDGKAALSGEDIDAAITMCPMGAISMASGGDPTAR